MIMSRNITMASGNAVLDSKPHTRLGIVVGRNREKNAGKYKLNAGTAPAAMQSVVIITSISRENWPLFPASDTDAQPQPIPSAKLMITNQFAQSFQRELSGLRRM